MNGTASAGSGFSSQWDNSYRNRDNFVFYPEEELIRFFSRYIRKRVGFAEWEDQVAELAPHPKVLDLGCGIGRHMAAGLDFHFDMYGIDLSQHAVEQARRWTSNRGGISPDKHAVVGSVDSLPWNDGWFDYAISHAVLDSMPFETARTGCLEVHRVLKPRSLFYFDVIAGQGGDFAGELIVTGAHETGTIQSYFDAAKIDELLGDGFEVLQKLHVVRTDYQTGKAVGRWHVVTRRR